MSYHDMLTPYSSVVISSRFWMYRASRSVGRQVGRQHIYANQQLGMQVGIQKSQQRHSDRSVQFEGYDIINLHTEIHKKKNMYIYISIHTSRIDSTTRYFARCRVEKRISVCVLLCCVPWIYSFIRRCVCLCVRSPDSQHYRSMGFGGLEGWRKKGRKESWVFGLEGGV